MLSNDRGQDQQHDTETRVNTCVLPTCFNDRRHSHTGDSNVFCVVFLWLSAVLKSTKLASVVQALRFKNK